ncbi:myb domain protein 27 [Hibiscus trionum]|uniref:Myb domain protein 27 n=1 Tax=Hibiscus trionum TaxID=183268 RepID=A0A9W7IXA0_HIBTR|nr:myb domain protein 27 [Hibiscus trionum]
MSNETNAAATQGESMRKGPWHEDEDERLVTFVKLLGSRRWDYVARVSGLNRSGKSCRLRWVNYLRPNLKHGSISAEEEMIILKLHEKWGNKWSMIARRLPGRTDNEIKNYWRTHLSKKAVTQDQESFRFGEDDHGKQIFVFQGDDSNSYFKTYNGESYNPCMETSDTKNIAYAAAVSDFDLTVTSTSPYETRLSDWILEFQSEIKSEEDYNTTHSCCCYPACFTEENDLWGCSDSLWNME